MIIEIQPAPIPVSYLSSLLRIIQVALRETAFSSSHIDPSASHQPILLASLSEKNNKLSIEFSFVDSKTNAYLEMLSESIFEEFFQNFGEYIKTLPQPSLWGPKTSIETKKTFPSVLEKRLSEVYREMKRISKSKITVTSRSISIEGFNLTFS